MSLIDTTVITTEIAITEEDLKRRLLEEALAGLGLTADNASVTEAKVLRGENRRGGYRIRIRRDMALDDTKRLEAPK